MRKTWGIVAALALTCMFGGMYWLFSTARSFPDHCAFCEPDVLQRQTFYEDDLVVALYTHKPVLPGHCLVLPKRHVERFEALTDEELTRMGQVIKKVDQAVANVFGTSAYLLLQKNGLEVGQTVPHVHVHYIPRKTGDHSTFSFLINMYLADLKGPISLDEMQETVEKLKQTLESV